MPRSGERFSAHIELGGARLCFGFWSRTQTLVSDVVRTHSEEDLSGTIDPFVERLQLFRLSCIALPVPSWHHRFDHPHGRQ